MAQRNKPLVNVDGRHELRVELLPLAQVTPYERNPRKGGDPELVAGSIRQFGFLSPIIVDEDLVILAGHVRHRAATSMSLERVPVIVVRGLSEAKKKAFRILDNKAHESSSWELELLGLELKELVGAKFEMATLGFSTDELAGLMENSGGGLADLVVQDQAPGLPDTATTRAGDVWILGRHRLMCGDSSDSKHVAQLLDGARIHLVNMDPPYNVKVEPRSNNAIAAGLSSFAPSKTAGKDGLTKNQHFDQARMGKRAATDKKLRPKDRPLANDFISDEAFEGMLRAWFKNAAAALEPGRSFYIWGGYANCANYPSALLEAGFYFSQAVIWVKEHPVLTRKDFMGNHEWCFYGWKEGAGHKWFGPNNASDVWSVKKLNHTAMVHLTEKPVELAARALQYSSREGENVLDLFGGSGSTLIACEQAKRNAFLMELDTLYADVIVERWQKLSGQHALLESEDRSFVEVAASRRKGAGKQRAKETAR